MDYPEDPKDFPKDKKEMKDMIEEHNKAFIHPKAKRTKLFFTNGWERIFGHKKKEHKVIIKDKVKTRDKQR